MNIECTIEELRESSAWECVFGESDCTSACSQDVESLDGTPTGTVLRSDVAEIIALVDGENDSDEWIGVFRLIDGRYLAACGWCDYTGWG